MVSSNIQRSVQARQVSEPKWPFWILIENSSGQRGRICRAVACYSLSTLTPGMLYIWCQRHQDLNRKPRGVIWEPQVISTTFLAGLPTCCLQPRVVLGLLEAAELRP